MDTNNNFTKVQNTLMMLFVLSFFFELICIIAWIWTENNGLFWFKMFITNTISLFVLYILSKPKNPTT